VRGYRKGENPARWKGHLDHILPARNKVQKAKHHAALDYRDVGDFMAALKAVDGMGARALEFAILTATRSGEVRGATWAEIDHKAGVWIIPAERMKAEREHRVPLSPAVLAMLESLPRMVGTTLIFPSAKNDALSDMTLTAVIRRMHEASTKAGNAGWCDGAGKVITAHGFRSTFRDWAGETTAYPREVIEHALAHQLKDKAEAAYQRGDLLDKRRRLMADWAKHCTTEAKAASVTPIRASK
jgi:integrase